MGDASGPVHLSTLKLTLRLCLDWDKSVSQSMFSLGDGEAGWNDDDRDWIGEIMLRGLEWSGKMEKTVPVFHGKGNKMWTFLAIYRDAYTEERCNSMKVSHDIWPEPVASCSDQNPYIPIILFFIAIYVFYSLHLATRKNVAGCCRFKAYILIIHLYIGILYKNLQHPATYKLINRNLIYKNNKNIER